MNDKQHLPENIQTLLGCLSVAGMAVLIVLGLYILGWEGPSAVRDYQIDNRVCSAHSNEPEEGGP